MKTFAYEMLGRVVVWVGSPTHSPANDQWDDYVAAVRKHVATFRDRSCSYVWSGGPGTGPSAPQRMRLAKVVGPNIKVAVLLGHPVERGIATAVSWFLRGMKIFAPNEVHAAAGHLELTDEEERLVLACVARLRLSLTPS